MSYDNCPLCGRSRSECTNIAVCCASRNEAELATLRTQLAAAQKDAKFYEESDIRHMGQLQEIALAIDPAWDDDNYPTQRQILERIAQLAAAQSDAAALRNAVDDGCAILRRVGRAETVGAAIKLYRLVEQRFAALLTPASPKGAAPGQASNDRWNFDMEKAPRDRHIDLYGPAVLYEGKLLKERVTEGYWWDIDDFDENEIEPYWYSEDGGFTKEHPPIAWRYRPEPPKGAEMPDAKGEG